MDPTANPNVPPLTVLVIDEDEPSAITSAATLILDGRAREVFRAGDGDEALALERRHRPDMIVVHWSPGLATAGVTLRQAIGDGRSIVAIVDDQNWLAMAEARMCCADRAFWRSDMSYGLWMAAAEAARRAPAACQRPEVRSAAE